MDVMGAKRESAATAWLIVGVVLVAVLLFYLLSVGPAARLVQNGYLDLEIYRAVYAPLQWLSQWPSFRDILNTYTHWWV